MPPVLILQSVRGSTVLSEAWYKVAYKTNTIFLIGGNVQQVKAVGDASQYIKMYVAGVSAKTVEGYFKDVEELVIRLHSKVWSNL